MLQRRFCVCVLCAALGAALALGFLVLAAQPAYAQGPTPRQPLSFINDVAPIFKENCFACHDAKKRKGKLNMTTYEGLRNGGAHEDPIEPGKPEDSELIQLINGSGVKRMPPKDSGDPLPRQKVAVIEQWIREGAKLDAGLEPASDLVRELRLRWQPPTPPAAYEKPVMVNALVFTPDSQKLVAGGQYELTVWDVASGKLEERVYTRAERAYAMTFLPDGKLAVAGGRPGQEGDVRIYNLQGGTPKNDNGVLILDGVHDKGVLVQELLETDDVVLCLAVSADGQRLAAGGCDRVVRVWDLGAGYDHVKPEQTIENHADWVFGVAFTPDGKHLLTASRDKTAKVWDLAAKESVHTFTNHQNDVYAVAARLDGKTAVSVGADNQVRFWNVTGSDKEIRSLGGHGKAVFKVLQHPTQPRLITCSADQTVRIWNSDSGAAVRVLTGHTDWVYALALSPDGNLIASGSWDGEVRIWKVADGSLVRSFIASPGAAARKTAP